MSLSNTHSHTHTHTHTQTKSVKHGLLSAIEEVYDIFRDGGTFLLLFIAQQFSLCYLIKEAETSSKMLFLTETFHCEICSMCVSIGK